MKRLLSFLLTGITLLTSTGFHTANIEEMEAVSAVTESITYTIEDVRNMQDFLLAKPTETDLTGKPYDLNGDDRWDVFDLCLMKREVLENSSTSANDTLVVYFSRTGNTEKIAQYLIDLADADSYVIEAAVPYTDEDIAYNNSSCRANQEQNDKTVRPEIAEPISSLDNYDTVFIGYPIWWGQEPRIIDTFLESYDFSDKTVIPFCTSASSGISTSEKNIADLVPIGNQLAGKRFAANASRDDVAAWYASLPLEQAEQKLQITVGDTVLTATLADNSSAQAFAELLKNGAVTVDMHDYGSFEKVGELPETLPRNDEQITTEPGDLILYLGSNITIYYDVNTWNFTKLGHIDNITQNELKSILGDGNVSVTFSLK